MAPYDKTIPVGGQHNGVSATPRIFPVVMYVYAHIIPRGGMTLLQSRNKVHQV